MKSNSNRRWVAISAALAASVSAVAVVGVRVGASSETTASGADTTTFVAIAPCRIVDTRPEFGVGSRSTPLGPRETHRQQVTGHVGDCVVPPGASAVSLNVTAVEPTASGFLTVFPFGSKVPNSSDLNWVPGSAPTTNRVVVQLSESGALGFYNFDGRVDLVVDVGGYYTKNGIQDAMNGLRTKADVDSVYTKSQTYARGQVDAAIDTLDEEIADEIDDKADADQVYTKGQTYARGQVDAAIDTLDAEIAGEIDDKADADQVYTKAETYSSAEVDATVGTLQSTVDTIGTELAGKAATSELATAVSTLDAALAGKADSGDLADAVTTIDTALAGKADTSNIYDRDAQEDLFLGRNPEVVMRQATGDLDGIPGVDLSGLGVVLSVGLSPAIELTGPASLGDEFGDVVDYRLNAVEICTTGAGQIGGVAVLDTISVSVRGFGGDIIPVTVPVGTPDLRQGAQCYTVDVTAASTGSTYYLQLTTVGLVGVDTVAVTGVNTTWGPAFAEL